MGMKLTRQQRYLVTIGYLVFISILFCLPGSALPKNEWLAKIYFDKWVHIGLFLVLAVLCIWALQLYKRKVLFVLILILAGYGLLVETVQHYFIENRSFDIGDWIADIAGSVAGVWLSWVHIKK